MNRRSYSPPPPSRPPTTPASRRSRISPWATSSAVVAVLALAGPTAAQPKLPKAEPAESEDRVLALLRRLGLGEYEVLHLEAELARAGSGREAVAGRLVEAYLNQLLDGDTPAGADATARKVQALVRQYSALNSPRVRILLLQGEYARAEVLAGKWVLDPDDADARKGAGELLARIAPDLDDHAATLGKAFAKETEALDKLSESGRKAREPQVNRLGQQFGRAAFFAGWANYYLGLIRAAEARAADVNYRRARDAFRKLVGGEGPPAEPEAIDELGLASPVRARAVLGLALAEAATGDPKASGGWFKVLGHTDVPDEVRAGLDFWQVFAAVKHTDPAEAVAVARAAVDGIGSEFNPHRRTLCVFLVQAGASGRAGQLGELGVRGLVQMRQYDLARKLGGKFGLADPATPLGRLVAAMSLLDGAEKSKAVADFRAAAAEFAGAAELSDGKKETGLAHRCRFQAGYALARAGDWPPAAGTLEKVVPPLRAARSDLAPEAAWTLIVAYDKQAADPQVKLRLVSALKDFMTAYPSHPKYVAARGLVLKHDPAAAASLTAGAADAGTVLLAARKAHQQWRAVRGDAAREAELAGQVFDAIDKFLAQPGSATDAVRLEALFLGIDAAANSAKPDLKRAADWLAAAAPLAEAAAPESKTAADLRVLQLQRAQAAGDTASAKAAADWLIQNRPKSPYHEAALVGRAKAADVALAAAEPVDRPARLDAALDAYRALAGHAGTDPDKIKASKNAQIANSRLAVLALDRSRLDECRQVLEERLLKAYPREVKYLRLAGLMYDAIPENDRALECWQILTKGLPADSDGWYEAKYKHMAALARVSKAEAQEAFAQFKALRPDFGPPAMRDQFKQLEATLKE